MEANKDYGDANYWATLTKKYVKLYLQECNRHNEAVAALSAYRFLAMLGWSGCALFAAHTFGFLG